MKVIERLDMYIEAKKLNDNKVTQQCGLSKGLLYKTRKRGCDIGRSTINRILSTYTDLNSTWLLTGEGDMLIQSSGDIVINNVKQNSGQVGKGSFEQMMSSNEEELRKEIASLNEQLQREIEHSKLLQRIIENMMKNDK